MKLTDFFLAELEREASSSRLALQRVPEGHNDWKPDPKSMPLGYLASLVATMPAWIVSMVKQDEFDMRSPDAAKFKPLEWAKREELTAALDNAVAQAREALQGTTEEHLMKTWKFVVGGHVVSESPRHVAITESVFSHLAHHRGQLTVYLRLNEAPVPALYGPSADEGRFD
ncbi:MAG TPA: DinB family protein [Candidatus Sulfotelmatobacter sp.]|nr:DinB family protein [Candidatus Sulfotelmatobacter sp.]